MKPELIFDCRHELAEGPVWYDGAFWWVNITGGTLNRLDLATQSHREWKTGQMLGAAVPSTDGRWLLARQRGFAFLNLKSGAMDFITDPEPDRPRHRFNDSKCDAMGRFWAGTMDMNCVEPSANLYALDASLTCRRMLDGVTISNGLAWSADGRTMFYADSPTGRVDVFDYDLERGAISNRRTLLHVASGSPDGMAIDVEDNIWLAQWGGNCVTRYDGHTGRELARIEFPVSQVSSCCFGGANLDELFVTSAWEHFDDAKRKAEPLAGSIFRLKTSTRGTPVVPFRSEKFQ